MAPPPALPTDHRTPMRLTARELDLLEFVLDQKFANLDALYLRFFHEKGSRSSRYAYHRLQLLTEHGFLRAIRVYTEPGKFYLASPLAHSTIQSLRPERTISMPVDTIDYRTFEHDKRVMLCRAFREKKGEVKEWLSERRLKQEWTAAKGYRFERDYMPDAIYTNRAGGRAAFELELAPKTRERYAKKVSRFLEVMRDKQGAFSRTLFVTCSDPVHNMLISVTRPYNEFRVMRYEEVVTVSSRKGGG